MAQEMRNGAFVRNPKNVLRVARTKDNRNASILTKGTQAVVNIAKKITGRNTNVLQTSRTPLDKKKRDFYKNAADIPEHRRAKSSVRDIGNNLSVAAKKED